MIGDAAGLLACSAEASGREGEDEDADEGRKGRVL